MKNINKFLILLLTIALTNNLAQGAEIGLGAKSFGEQLVEQGKEMAQQMRKHGQTAEGKAENNRIVEIIEEEQEKGGCLFGDPLLEAPIRLLRTLANSLTSRIKKENLSQYQKNMLQRKADLWLAQANQMDQVALQVMEQKTGR